MKLQTLVTLGTYGLPLGVAACLLAMNTGLSEELFEFKSTKWAGLFWLSVVGIVGYVIVLLVSFRSSKEHRREQFWVPLIASAVIVLFALAVMEFGVRIVSKPHPFGHELGALVLKPYEWGATKKHNQRLYENSLDADAYYVGHPTLGWTIGPSRTSQDGLYSSSVEGLRSKNAGDELFDADNKIRIALFGDSFMFSEEVGYEDSLAIHMEATLGDAYQVLNFGVPGYGIDQAYLRFADEVQTWAPSIAVLGFIADDLFRAANVYTFLKPSWGIPFSKPRFTLAGDKLELLNVPNLGPGEMFSAESISELPNLSEDTNYFAFNWQRNVTHHSMLYRLLITAFPRIPPSRPNTSDSVTAEIGAKLTKRFVDEANERGITPVVMYLPSRSHFVSKSPAVARIKDTTIEKASELGVEVLDMTDCLRENLSFEQLFVTNGVHYSGEGNKEFARCLISQLSEQALADRRGSQ